MTLSFFASRSIAEAIHSEMPADQPPLERTAEILRDARPIAIAEYASVGRTIQKALAPRVAKAPARSAKVPRNAPWPCGSGKNYKKCCGAMEREPPTG